MLNLIFPILFSVLPADVAPAANDLSLPGRPIPVLVNSEAPPEYAAKLGRWSEGPVLSDSGFGRNPYIKDEVCDAANAASPRRSGLFGSLRSSLSLSLLTLQSQRVRWQI